MDYCKYKIKLSQLLPIRILRVGIMTKTKLSNRITTSRAQFTFLPNSVDGTYEDYETLDRKQ